MSLTVTVYSFSYKKGIPVSADGGGYVFDCRGMENPGRYEQYKQLTGLDAPVIEFLESKGEIQLFLDDAQRLVLRHINNFLSRGFENLMVCFGCTGGQHRSVYCAEHFAAWVKASFPDVNVHLVHRERGLDRGL